MKLAKMISNYKVAFGVPLATAGLIAAGVYGITANHQQQTTSTQTPQPATSQTQQTEPKPDKIVALNDCDKPGLVQQDSAYASTPIKLFNPDHRLFELTVEGVKEGGSVDPITGFPEFEEIKGLDVYANYSPKETNPDQPGRRSVLVFSEKLRETANALADSLCNPTDVFNIKEAKQIEREI